MRVCLGDENVYNNLYFAWIDSRIFHIINDFNTFKDYINVLDSYAISKKSIIIPGCSPKGYNMNNIFNMINWRFCGGFFLGDKDSLINMYNLSVNNFEFFLSINNIIVWEVNYWAWLESYFNLNFDWYKADHNDTIIQIPLELLI